LKINQESRVDSSSFNSSIKSIVIKPGPGVDPAKGRGPGFHGSTRVNPEKLKKIKVLIFHMKKYM
jgi:hypothetical protein